MSSLRHTIISLRPAFRSSFLPLCVSAFALAYMLYSLASGADGLVAVVCIGIIAFAMWRPLLTIVLNRYDVLPDRIRQTYGIIATKETEMPLERIITVNVRRSVIGRILNFGTIEFSSAAREEPDVVFRDVIYPKLIEAEIWRLKKQVEQGIMRDDGSAGLASEAT